MTEKWTFSVDRGLHHCRIKPRNAAAKSHTRHDGRQNETYATPCPCASGPLHKSDKNPLFTNDGKICTQFNVYISLSFPCPENHTTDIDVTSDGGHGEMR